MQKIRRTGGLFLSHCALCTRRNSVQLLDTMPPSVTLHPLTAIQASLPCPGLQKPSNRRAKSQTIQLQEKEPSFCSSVESFFLSTDV